MTQDAYHSDVSRISNSMLSLLKESPRKFYNRYELGQYSKPTPAMIYGSVAHCLTFEPQEVGNRFAIVPNVDGRTTEGKAEKKKFYDTLGDKEAVDSDVFRAAASASFAARSHLEFTWFAANASEAIIEKRIDFELEGTLCRCKPDFIHLERQVIWDLKTTENASPSDFARSVAVYGYHRQDAFYREAVRQKYGIDCRFLFLVVSKSDPWESAVYELDELDTRQGMQEILFLMSELQARKATNNWEQVWGSGVVPLSLPKWYKSNLYDFEEVVS